MGFRYTPRQYKLNFEDSELAGLEVITNGVTLAEYNAVDGDEALIKLFANKLISWNLEDDNGAVPATRESLENQDYAFGRSLLEAWFREITGAQSPLSKTSDSGQRLEEASLGMVPSSPSPMN